MGEIGLLTASSARTILTRASTSSLTSTLFHNKMGEEINYLLAYTYTWGIGYYSNYLQSHIQRILTYIINRI